MSKKPVGAWAIWLTALAFIAAGINHFWHPAIYVRIMPPMFPAKRELVFVSGFFEIAGGIGLTIRRLRQSAGIGLILLLIAVFPANIYMAVDSDRFTHHKIPLWIFWARLPMQLVLIAWVWRVSRDDRGNPNLPSVDV